MNKNLFFLAFIFLLFLSIAFRVDAGYSMMGGGFYGHSYGNDMMYYGRHSMNYRSYYPVYYAAPVYPVYPVYQTYPVYYSRPYDYGYYAPYGSYGGYYRTSQPYVWY